MPGCRCWVGAWGTPYTSGCPEHSESGREAEQRWNEHKERVRAQADSRIDWSLELDLPPLRRS